MAKRAGLVGTVIVAGIVAFFLLIVFTSSYTQVQFGTVGMVTRFGRITGQIMQPRPELESALCRPRHRLPHARNGVRHRGTARRH